MKRISVFILIQSIFLTAFAQSSAKVGGKVVDSGTQAPVEFAAVTLTNPSDSSILTGGITDAEGKFLLSDVQPGTYLLHCSFVGYIDLYKNLVIPENTPFVPAGMLSIEQDATLLENVEVTGEKSYFQGSIDKKVYNIEKDIVASNGSAAEALETIPSVVIDMDGNISLRGSNGVRIFIDGKPSGIVGSNMAAILEQIPASSIESIEVITNPSARYDAEGSAGIINIVMKKNKKVGLNGAVSASASTAPRYEGNISLNYRDKKVNIYTNYGYTHDDRDFYGYSNRKTFEPDTTYYLNSESDGKSLNNMQMGRAGIDYYINDKNTIGINGGLHTSKGTSTNDVSYSFRDLDSVETSSSDRLTTGNDDGTYYSVGLTYRKTYESPKHYISASADWSKGSGHSLEDYDEQFFDMFGAPVSDPFLQSLSRPEINKDATLQTDYVHPIKNGNQLETGLKYTKEIKDNTLYSESYNYTDADWNVDDSINNQFVYDQDVYAAYLIWNSSIKKFGYQLGLRAEQTYTNSELVTTNETFKNTYFGLFPSVHTAYKFSETSEISASYSRRISRPRSWFLNPFPDYSDPYNLRRGNPFLEPEYENSYEIGYTKEFKKHSLSASVYYRQTLNEISPYIYVDAEGISNMTFENYNTEDRYGIELVGKHEFFKWWNMTSSFNFNQTLVDAQNLENGLTNSVTMYNVRLMSFFQLPKSTSLQVTYMYNTPWTFAQGQFDPVQSLDLGTKTDLFKNTFSIALSVRDVFNTRQWSGYSEGYNFYSEVLRKRESRIGTLTLTYKFGQQDRRRGKQGMDENYEGGGFDMF